MKTFISHAEPLEEILEKVVNCDELHAKWLNTLSYLENCGARKIAACEHPTLVKEEMLKHAAEEFRHALHLKRQIGKISSNPMGNYCPSLMLGGSSTLHYLTSLDIKTSRYLKGLGLNINLIKEYAYLLVTYAIEIRAEELYPLYDAALRKTGSRITVKSILLEEKEQLEEMKKGIKLLPLGYVHAEWVCELENELCKNWLNSVQGSL